MFCERYCWIPACSLFEIHAKLAISINQKLKSNSPREKKAGGLLRWNEEDISWQAIFQSFYPPYYCENIFASLWKYNSTLTKGQVWYCPHVSDLQSFFVSIRKQCVHWHHTCIIKTRCNNAIHPVVPLKFFFKVKM